MSKERYLIERRDFMTTYKPVILGFVLATTTTLVGSFIYMRDEVNATRMYQEAGYQYRSKFDNHLLEFHALQGRMSSLEQDIAASVEVRRELKDLLRRNEEMLMKVNITLTQTSAVTANELSLLVG